MQITWTGIEVDLHFDVFLVDAVFGRRSSRAKGAPEARCTGTKRRQRKKKGTTALRKPMINRTSSRGGSALPLFPQFARAKQSHECRIHTDTSIVVSNIRSESALQSASCKRIVYFSLAFQSFPIILGEKR